MTYAAFGPRRIMWGSDWPNVLDAEGYGRALHLALHDLPVQSEDDLAWIMGRTAESLFRFEAPARPLIDWPDQVGT
jgi:predicted TIM-barrel fold metal-dependent hydrolase